MNAFVLCQINFINKFKTYGNGSKVVEYGKEPTRYRTVLDHLVELMMYCTRFDLKEKRNMQVELTANKSLQRNWEKKMISRYALTSY